MPAPYQRNALGQPIFAGFVCPKCFRLEVAANQLEIAEEAAELAQVKEEIKLCAECGLFPAANPKTDLCHQCINDLEEWRTAYLVEKLAPYTKPWFRTQQANQHNFYPKLDWLHPSFSIICLFSYVKF